jgi:valyl-tRNA synthetase
MAEKGVFATEGENFVQILAAARKVKSEAQVSMKTEASMLTVAGEGELESLIGDTVERPPRGHEFAGRQGGRRCRGITPAISPDERFTVALALIQAE